MAIITTRKSLLHTHFFRPLADLFSQLKHHRQCPAVSDLDWLHIGICRVLEGVKSGRDFLQSMQAKLTLPHRLHFFAVLKSKRRLALCQEANTSVVRTMHQCVPDAFAAYCELKLFDLHACDGHVHAAAAHDPHKTSTKSKSGLAKFGTSHLYSLNLRNHALTHMTIADQAERKREHEMRTLKRLTLEQLRQGAAVGRKVLYIYDPACVDYALWRELKQGGVYFLTRQKSNAKMLRSGQMPFDLSAPVNAGVVIDEQAGVGGTMLRHIRYRDPLSEEEYDFLTNEMTICPGLLARLYQMRWDIEKVYDQVKNKCEEKKAWASTPIAKTMQATFICLAHNLMVIQEHKLATHEGVTNTSEIKRKASRLKKVEAALAEKKEVLPALQKDFQRLTQRSLKYVRWLRAHLFVEAPWASVVAALKDSYAVF